MSSKSTRKAILFLVAVACATFFMLPMMSVQAQDTPPELRGSGLPLPRFVSLGSEKVYVRSGPAPRYPVKWVYKKGSLPVEIVQEFDVWRKIRDAQGDEGWVNKALLSNRRSVIIQGDEAAQMQDDASGTGRVVARLEPGVIASLDKCEKDLCRVSAGGFSGWVKRKTLWGIYAKEEIN